MLQLKHVERESIYDPPLFNLLYEDYNAINQHYQKQIHFLLS